MLNKRGLGTTNTVDKYVDDSMARVKKRLSYWKERNRTEIQLHKGRKSLDVVKQLVWQRYSQWEVSGGWINQAWSFDAPGDMSLGFRAGR